MAKKKLPKQVKLVLEHTPHQIDYRREKNVSASQILMYDECPHKWKLSKIDKLQIYTPSVHTVFGTAMHEVIQDWLHIMYSQSAKAANEVNLREQLKLKMREVYEKERKKTKEVFTTADELNSFFLDGLGILSYLQKKRSSYFSLKNTYLAGIETDIVQEIRPNVYFKGYIDLVFYNKLADTYTIIDIKTSTRGWSDYEKKNDGKIAQILLYKEFFAKQFNVNVDQINVEYFILRRKINQDAEFIARRVQEWRPASGKVKRGKAVKLLNEFVDNAFKDGDYNLEGDFAPTPSKSACMFCPYKEEKSLCSHAIN
jgi:hypothetical protein